MPLFENSDKKQSIADLRQYRVKEVQTAKEIALAWLIKAELENAIQFGLPEIDDRYHLWRVPLINPINLLPIGEIVINAYTSIIVDAKSTAPKIIEARILGRDETITVKKTDKI